MKNPPKIVEVTVTPEYVKNYDYLDGRKCALFHTLKDMHFHLTYVNPFNVITTDGLAYNIKPPFDNRAYCRVKSTGEPFTCLLIPCDR